MNPPDTPLPPGFRPGHVPIVGKVHDDGEVHIFDPDLWRRQVSRMPLVANRPASEAGDAG